VLWVLNNIFVTQLIINKMKSNFKFFLAILSVVFVFTACNKYEEGPMLSVLTKKARLTGDWKVEKRISASGDVQLFQTNEVLKINKSGSFDVFVADSLTRFGTWAFAKEKEYVYFTYKKEGVDNIDEFKIIRLKNKELWMEDTEGVQFNYVPA